MQEPRPWHGNCSSNELRFEVFTLRARKEGRSTFKVCSEGKQHHGQIGRDIIRALGRKREEFQKFMLKEPEVEVELCEDC